MTDSRSSSLRARLPRIFTRSSTAYGADLQELIRIVKINHPKGDLGIIERAYVTASHYHTGQLRKSGEEYISHPLAVAKILADLGSGPATIAAALLHDTVEDTGYPLEALKKEFGEEVALLVDGVTKLDKVKFGDSAQAETMRKMVVAMSKDVRVLVIKLADRLHNARTWGFVAQESAKRKAQETLEIYAPLAHRLGISMMKVELEDISFAVLYPKVYEEIVSLVGQRNPTRSEYTENVIDEITAELKEGKVKAKIDGRPKQYYSIYQKMVLRGREFDDIYDLVGIRVIVGSVKDCYGALGAIHAKWSPLPGRFKDYIAMPKFNLYQSLHTTVVGPEGRAVEIQIRTSEMHQRAEYGVAAHWKYKTQSGKTGDKEVDFAWLKQLSDWQEETADSGEFLDNLRFEIGAKELYVFTPKGKVVGLAAGSTPVDFAYTVHTEVGHKTIGAKVNGRLVPLESKLQAGDVIEILASKSENAGPSKDWLNFVASPRAKAKIKHYFTQERRELATEDGKEALVKALRKQGLPIQALIGSQSLQKVAQENKHADIQALYNAIGQGQLSTISVIERLKQLEGYTEELQTEEIPIQLPKSLRGPRSADQGVMVKGSAGVLTKMARCCTPVPGDPIIGFVTRGEGVSVHREDCKNCKSLNPERVVEVSWADQARGVFMVQIQVEALDRSGLLSDVTRVLTENHVNILNASVSTGKDRVALSKFVFEMADPSHLDHVLNQVKRIEAVYDVYRVKSS
ncbi:bifunctional (p)ppGpp synthetase/guanosine-3',5'-bis(diphosphate) 3'-pyrophosphohydrolase [Candidatus Aquiluna sp. UB-MaderosW2red]|uniref:RelA/SpoT family protein n=1 Tax=Candidatus Aquiluna sp. UB-MaderosW2red TaxID=1855377 RepID=UPI000875DA8F|nr:bifunctional (p)ppGpp synthetase/guanosine-3',5'-bis(diphosphate) 3'-pyrophosphohydrolase [Candidatus Aquiluna sp. UB-MaderosW2red]SCX11488.1 GTP pyrophosphokinase [Candidatus Aquiluna sp. UB-MaderosW2red]